MPCSDARVRTIDRTRAFVFLALLLVTREDASGGELRLPATAAVIAAEIAAACPTCPAAGYVPCGSPDVGWGRRWAPHAFLGTPRRTYLPTFTLSGGEFRRLARTTEYGSLVDALRTRFAATRLVVVDDAFGGVRVLPPPASVEVTFPEALHACVRDGNRAWACCATDCRHECCEKSLGSPAVTLTWPDGDDRITFRYGHTIGVSSLERRSPDRRVRYACLTDARGTLRAAAAPRPAR